MKRTIALLLAVIISLYSCTSNAGSGLLNPHAFRAKLKEQKTKYLLDVRTPGEYKSGHLAQSVNIDWNGSGFEDHVAQLDKSTPVFVYCAAGGRSHAAYSRLSELGFTEIYELEGGINNWKAAGLDLTTEDNSKEKGMSMKEYHKMLDTDKLVLVDYYATWCTPCKKMEPFLNELSKDHADKMILKKINADKNTAVVQALNISGLPTLLLYKNKKLIWSTLGYIGKDELSEILSKFD